MANGATFKIQNGSVVFIYESHEKKHRSLSHGQQPADAGRTSIPLVEELL